MPEDLAGKLEFMTYTAPPWLGQLLAFCIKEREKARKLMGSRGERRGGGLKKYGKNQHFAVDDVAPVCQCHVVYVRHLVLSVSHWPFVKVA